LQLGAVKRVMLVISHPDDEVMFFGPTILGLTKAAALHFINIISFFRFRNQ
jgi:LmbE family N-acetylglucosaminyl deacetylase